MTKHSLVMIAGLAMLASGCRAARQPETPENAQMAPKTGVASFYGGDFAGKKTASGEPFRLNAMTAASRTLPLGSRVEVSNLETGQSASVRINDRGPYAKGRLIDLSPKAAQRVGISRDNGLAQVRVKPTFLASDRQ